MKKITIKDGKERACKTLEDMIIKLNDLNALRLDNYMKLELLGEEEIRLSNKHESLDDKMMSLSLSKSLSDDTIAIDFKDYNDFVRYTLECDREEKYAQSLFNTAQELAINGNLETLEESIEKMFKKIDK